MKRFVQVLLRAKRKDVAHCIQVLIILVAVFAVTWDINSVDVAELSQKIFRLLSVINWDDSGTSSLKEISVGCFKEALVLKLNIVGPLLRDRLCEDSNDGLVGLGSDVVSAVLDDGLSLVAAQVVGSVAL